MVRLEETKDGVIIPVKAIPRSSKNTIGSIVGDEIQVKVTAAPVEGASNAAIIELLAKLLHIGKTQVEIVSGQHAKHKRIQVSGVSAEQVRTALGLD